MERLQDSDRSESGVVHQRNRPRPPTGSPAKLCVPRSVAGTCAFEYSASANGRQWWNCSSGAQGYPVCSATSGSIVITHSPGARRSFTRSDASRWMRAALRHPAWEGAGGAAVHEPRVFAYRTRGGITRHGSTAWTEPGGSRATPACTMKSTSSGTVVASTRSKPSDPRPPFNRRSCAARRCQRAGRRVSAVQCEVTYSSFHITPQQ